MQILYLIKTKPDETLEKLIAAQRITHEVEVIDLRETSDYKAILDQVGTADRIISW